MVYSCNFSDITFHNCFKKIKINNFKNIINKNNVLIILILSILLLYVFVFCFIDFYGADISIYHLAIPRGIIWDHGYVFNPFFFGAGMPAGWHTFGVPAFLIGNKLGYLGLTFWVFLCIIFSIYKFFTEHIKSLTFNEIMLVVLSGYFVIIIFLRDSLPNNDLPTLYLEISLGIFIYRSVKLNAGSDIIVGILSGFILCVKAQSIVGVVMLIIWYLSKKNNHFLNTIFRIFILNILFSMLWPINNIIDYGSPLPLMIPGLKILGHPWLPQYIESNQIIEMIHGRWYEANLNRLQSITFLPLVFVYLGNLFHIIYWNKNNNNLKSFLRIIVFYSLFKVLILFLITFRMDILFNDRYHLTSFFY